MERFNEVYALDPREIFAYSKRDLERVDRDLGQTGAMLAIFEIYLDPRYPDGSAPKVVTLGTRAQALDMLSTLHLFREAWRRVKTRREKSA